MAFRVWGLGLGMCDLGFGVYVLGFRVQGCGCRVWGVGFWVLGLGFGCVQRFREGMEENLAPPLSQKYSKKFVRCSILVVQDFLHSPWRYIGSPKP